MRRFSILALVAGLVLLPLAYAVATASHSQRLDKLEQHLHGEAYGHTGDLDAYFLRARSAISLTANQPAFRRVDELPGTRAQKIAKAPQSLRDATEALSYLEQLYPGAVGEACFTDAAGGEAARIVRGEVAVPRDLSPEKHLATFFGPTFSLGHGEVHQAAPYVSPDTNQWVIANATLVPSHDGVKRSIVHFELTVESLRRAVGSDSDAYDILVVDRTTGDIVVDGKLPQRSDAPLGRKGGAPFRDFARAARGSGMTDIDGNPAAYRRIERETGNVNDWVLVARSTSPAPTILDDLGLLPLGVGLLAVVLVMLGAVGLRSQRVELERAASTDSLTGLSNRRALIRDLERALGSDLRGTLALFDLDGFKSYNDTFGHLAGDALLTRLGAALLQAVRPRGRAYRLGGDEFCVLLPLEHRDDLVARAGAALSEIGESFAIGAAGGSVDLPTEANTVSDALRIADQRMYAAKQTGRTTAGRESKDVLLRALAERHPDLGDHLDGVADLAVALGHELGLRGEDLDHVRHAAELHDIGKVAIPDAILHKPGPLDENEWEFMRRHMLIGERIIAAAPSLTRVAKLVRASHERWDGGGYPDGTAGEVIPLGARVISVCDAFDAMLANRSYSPPMTVADAVAELYRCAGTQFDPHVVAVFAAVLDARAAIPAQR